jgi:hypothetical protein
MAGNEQAKEARRLDQAGYQVTTDGQGHWRVCDERGRWLANFPKTTCNRRWKDNLKTKVARHERLYAAQDAAQDAARGVLAV